MSISRSLTLLFAVSLASLLDPAVAPAQRTDGVPCAERKFDRAGRVQRCVLAEAYAVANGLVPAGSEAHFGQHGQVTRVVLARAAAFHGLQLPAKSSLFLDRSGNLLAFWLHEDAVIQGHRIPGHEDGVANVVYPNGRLRAAWLAREETIDGVPCTSSGNIARMGFRALKLGTQRMAWFHDDGKLQQCFLARDATIAGHRFRKGDVVLLRRDGSPDQESPKLMELRWRER